MAKFYSGVSGYVKMALQVAETSTDISANTSAISWALIAWFTGSSSSQWYSNSSHDISVVINGQTVFSRGSAEKILVSIGTDHASESNPVTIASGSLTVAHNSDGTKNISVSFSMAYKWASYAWSASGTLGLTTIARASQPSCITFPNTTENVGKLGDTIIIHANRASTSFTHTARYKWGSKEGTIATGIGDNVQWTIPVSLATEIPKDTSGWGNIFLDTYQNGNLIGTKSVAFMASVPSIPPTISNVKTEEAATLPENITGYVQAWSRLKITNTASGQYGASIQKYEVSVDGKTYTGNGITTNVIQISGNVPITVTVTDSRGQKTIVTVYATVQPYAIPKITGVSSYRCNASGELDASGAYICIHATGELSAINNQNGRACTAYWRKTTESSWKSKAIAMNSYKLDVSVIVDAATDASYNICVRLQDSFKLTDHYGSDVMSAFAFIDILVESDNTKKGLAIGKSAELAETVDLGWNLILRKEGYVYVDNEKYSIGQAAKAAADSGWKNISLAAGISAVDYIGAKIRKIGNTVNLVLGITGATKAFQTLATLPEGYRPSAELNIAARYYNMLSTGVAIESTGEIKLLATTSGGENYDSTGKISFAVTYFV